MIWVNFVNNNSQNIVPRVNNGLNVSKTLGQEYGKKIIFNHHSQLILDIIKIKPKINMKRTATLHMYDLSEFSQQQHFLMILYCLEDDVDVADWLFPSLVGLWMIVRVLVVA